MARMILKHIVLNLLQLLQLRLHPQPVCLVLELSSVVEHLKTIAGSLRQV